MSANLHDLHKSLPLGEVHLWFLTDALPSIGAICTDGFVLLSPQEKQRFVEMKNGAMARRFLLGRILLRRILAHYLDENPATLAFHYSTNGKPELDCPPATHLSFNLSHSASEVVLAVTRAPAIGVDIEAMGRADAAHRIAQRFFSTREIRDLAALGMQAPERALLLWALKESIVKANGDTVWDGLTKISLSVDGRRIDWPSSKTEGGSNWKLAASAFRHDFFLALAVKASSFQTADPLVFRTRQLGNETEESDIFEPEFKT